MSRTIVAAEAALVDRLRRLDPQGAALVAGACCERLAAAAPVRPPELDAFWELVTGEHGGPGPAELAARVEAQILPDDDPRWGAGVESSQAALVYAFRYLDGHDHQHLAWIVRVVVDEADHAVQTAVPSSPFVEDALEVVDELDRIARLADDIALRAVPTDRRPGRSEVDTVRRAAVRGRFLGGGPDEDGAGPARPLRVVQWATGNIGRRSLRTVIDDPGLELVGLVVHSPDKVGVDAGELCGAGPTGVLATADDDVDAVLALEPDCVLYMPQGTDVDALVRILAAGIDVVTTRGDFHHPPSLPADLRDRIEAACAAGGSSIHSTGSSPGFITEAVPLVLASLQTRIDGLHITESADLSTRASPEMLFGLLGYGLAPERFTPRRFAYGVDAFGPSMRLVAEGLGLALDEVTSTGEVAVAAHELEIAAGSIAAGTVAAQRMVVSGLRAGEPLFTFTASWYCTADLEPAWDLRPTGWHVAVDGDVPLDVQILLDIPLDRWAETTPGITAHRAVNAVPAVVAAPPGIRTTLDLPHILPTLGR